MNIRYYKIVNAEDTESEMANPGCVTTSPRYSLDKSQVVLKYKTQVTGSVSHAEILAVMRTSDWSAPFPPGSS
jgi:hypothetical protein